MAIDQSEMSDMPEEYIIMNGEVVDMSLEACRERHMGRIGRLQAAEEEVVIALSSNLSEALALDKAPVTAKIIIRRAYQAGRDTASTEEKDPLEVIYRQLQGMHAESAKRAIDYMESGEVVRELAVQAFDLGRAQNTHIVQ